MSNESMPALPCGKIIGEPNDVYHASPAISVSKMKVFRHSPRLYYGRFVAHDIEKPEATPALLFGSAVGALILEGRDVFDAQYYTVPEGIGKVKVGDKAIRAELEARNPGKLALSFDDATKIERMNKNVHEHHIAGPLLAACQPEITWRVKGENFHMQVRTDAWSEEGCELTKGEPFACDLKTIPQMPDDEPDIIARQISEYWYHGQAWTYREVVSQVSKYPPEFRPRFPFIFIEKSEPFAVQVVELDDAALDVAYIQVKDTLERMTWCHTHGRWPNSWADTWTKEPGKVALPGYYAKRERGETSNIW